MLRVFMGGTCNGSKWRELFKGIEGIEWFDPVVPDWNEEAQENELRHRAVDDILLYVITPKMTGVYSIAEVVDDSNKQPGRVVFSYTDIDEDSVFDNHSLKSLKAVANMIQKNGATYVPFDELESWFKSKVGSASGMKAVLDAANIASGIK